MSNQTMGIKQHNQSNVNIVEVSNTSTSDFWLSTSDFTLSQMMDSDYDNKPDSVFGGMNQTGKYWINSLLPEEIFETETYINNENDIYEDETFEIKCAKALWAICSPTLIVLGTIGNILSIIVLLQKKIRKTTTCLYLIVLAVVDTLVLYTSLLELWLYTIFDISFRHFSPVTCKIHMFLVYFLTQYEAWIIVLFTCERMLAVFLPHQVRRICMKPRAAIGLIICAVLLAVENSHFFWTYNQVVFIVDKDSGLHWYYCGVEDRYKSFRNYVLPWIDFCLSSLIPFIILIFSNSAIILRLLCRKCCCIRGMAIQFNDYAKMTTMTAILISVSIIFFITTAPISIYTISLNDGPKNHIIWASVNLVSYLNNSINFLLYCLSGPHFRREIRMLLVKCRDYYNQRHNQVHPVTDDTNGNPHNGVFIVPTQDSLL